MAWGLRVSARSIVAMVCAINFDLLWWLLNIAAHDIGIIHQGDGMTAKV